MAEATIPLFISAESIRSLDPKLLDQVHASAKRMGPTLASENDPNAVWSDQADHFWRVKAGERAVRHQPFPRGTT